MRRIKKRDKRVKRAEERKRQLKMRKKEFLFPEYLEYINQTICKKLKKITS